MSVPAFAGANCSWSTRPPASRSRRQHLAGFGFTGVRTRAKAVGNRSVAEGDETTATGDNTTAIGSWIDLDADGLVDANEITWANGARATAIGAAAQAHGRGHRGGRRAVGGHRRQQRRDRQHGADPVAEHHDDQDAPCRHANTVTTTTTTTNGPASNQSSIAIGNASRANGNNDIAMGNGATVENTSTA
jgi:hypothetical protein